MCSFFAFCSEFELQTNEQMVHWFGEVEKERSRGNEQWKHEAMKYKK